VNRDVVGASHARYRVAVDPNGTPSVRKQADFISRHIGRSPRR
jgi:hypothetical protein